MQNQERGDQCLPQALPRGSKYKQAQSRYASNIRSSRRMDSGFANQMIDSRHEPQSLALQYQKQKVAKIESTVLLESKMRASKCRKAQLSIGGCPGKKLQVNNTPPVAENPNAKINDEKTADKYEQVANAPIFIPTSSGVRTTILPPIIAVDVYSQRRLKEQGVENQPNGVRCQSNLSGQLVGNTVKKFNLHASSNSKSNSLLKQHARQINLHKSSDCNLDGFARQKMMSHIQIPQAKPNELNLDYILPQNDLSRQNKKQRQGGFGRKIQGSNSGFLASKQQSQSQIGLSTTQKKQTNECNIETSPTQKQKQILTNMLPCPVSNNNNQGADRQQNQFEEFRRRYKQKYMTSHSRTPSENIMIVGQRMVAGFATQLHADKIFGTQEKTGSKSNGEQLNEKHDKQSESASKREQAGDARREQGVIRRLANTSMRDSISMPPKVMQANVDTWYDQKYTGSQNASQKSIRQTGTIALEPAVIHQDSKMRDMTRKQTSSVNLLTSRLHNQSEQLSSRLSIQMQFGVEQLSFRELSYQERKGAIEKFKDRNYQLNQNQLIKLCMKHNFKQERHNLFKNNQRKNLLKYQIQTKKQNKSPQNIPGINQEESISQSNNNQFEHSQTSVDVEQSNTQLQGQEQEQSDYLADVLAAKPHQKTDDNATKSSVQLDQQMLNNNFNPEISSVLGICSPLSRSPVTRQIFKSQFWPFKRNGKVSRYHKDRRSADVGRSTAENNPKIPSSSNASETHLSHSDKQTKVHIIQPPNSNYEHPVSRFHTSHLRNASQIDELLWPFYGYQKYSKGDLSKQNQRMTTSEQVHMLSLIEDLKKITESKNQQKMDRQSQQYFEQFDPSFSSLQFALGRQLEQPKKMKNKKNFDLYLTDLKEFNFKGKTPFESVKSQIQSKIVTESPSRQSKVRLTQDEANANKQMQLSKIDSDDTVGHQIQIEMVPSLPEQDATKTNGEQFEYLDQPLKNGVGVVSPHQKNNVIIIQANLNDKPRGHPEGAQTNNSGIRIDSKMIRLSQEDRPPESQEENDSTHNSELIILDSKNKFYDQFNVAETNQMTPHTPIKAIDEKCEHLVKPEKAGLNRQDQFNSGNSNQPHLIVGQLQRRKESREKMDANSQNKTLQQQTAPENPINDKKLGSNTVNQSKTPVNQGISFEQGENDLSIEVQTNQPNRIFVKNEGGRLMGFGVGEQICERTMPESTNGAQSTNRALPFSHAPVARTNLKRLSSLEQSRQSSMKLIQSFTDQHIVNVSQVQDVLSINQSNKNEKNLIRIINYDQDINGRIQNEEITLIQPKVQSSPRSCLADKFSNESAFGIQKRGAANLATPHHDHKTQAYISDSQQASIISVEQNNLQHQKQLVVVSSTENKKYSEDKHNQNDQSEFETFGVVHDTHYDNSQQPGKDNYYDQAEQFSHQPKNQLTLRSDGSMHQNDGDLQNSCQYSQDNQINDSKSIEREGCGHGENLSKLKEVVRARASLEQSQLKQCLDQGLQNNDSNQHANSELISEHRHISNIQIANQMQNKFSNPDSDTQCPDGISQNYSSKNLGNSFETQYKEDQHGFQKKIQSKPSTKDTKMCLKQFQQKGAAPWKQAQNKHLVDIFQLKNMTPIDFQQVNQISLNARQDLLVGGRDIQINSDRQTNQQLPKFQIQNAKSANNNIKFILVKEMSHSCLEPTTSRATITTNPSHIYHQKQFKPLRQYGNLAK